ncbi:MAG: hypothetical protein WC614_07125 [bacterium]
MKRIYDAMATRDHIKAQTIAFQWAEAICEKYGLNIPNVWKFFKRDLVTKWFGKEECKRLSPNWSIKDIQEYTKLFPDKSFRLSIFPKNIACHATNYHLSLEDKKSWDLILLNIDKSLNAEIFLDRNPDSMCFRAFNTLGEFYIEAGIGQAMFVFEKEQGKHPMVIATLNNERYFFIVTKMQNEYKNISYDIKRKLQLFIKLHGDLIKTKCEHLRKTLGLAYICVEGYFDASIPNIISICDIDLPPDIAFFIKKQKTN